VTNNGPGQATGVVMTITLPTDAQGNQQVTFVSAAPGQGTVSGPTNGVLTASIGTLANGVSVAVRIVVIVGATPGTLTLTSSVSADQIDPNISDNTAVTTTLVTEPVDLGVSITDNPDPVLVGDQLTYTVTVTNFGPADATGVTLTDTLPPS